MMTQPWQARIRFVPRTGAAIDPRRDILVRDGDITLGRSPRSTVRLPHASVRFTHAKLVAAPGGLFLAACDGATVEGSLAGPGDSARIGIYRLTRAEPEADGTPVIIVAPEASTDTDEAGAAAWYERAFAVDLPNVRLLAFSLCCLITALFFILPLSFAPAKAPRALVADASRAAATPAEFGGGIARLWNVGVMSRPHSGFGGDCARCHVTAFQPVPSAACLTCHQDIGQHANPALAPNADLSAQRCEDCHREHKGLVLATRGSQSDCVACHANMHAVAPGSHARPVGDFASLHPEFAPSLVVDAGRHLVQPTERDSHDVSDQSGLRFTHKYHLALKSLHLPGAAACALCHTPEPGGATFKRVDFEAACARCHTLPFEPRHPEWRLPHGHPEEVQARITGYYANAILAGEQFPAPDTGIYAQPGVAPPPPPPEGAALVAALTQAAMASSIRRSDCGECHTVIKASVDRYVVAPVYLPDRYLPRAMFSHAAHSTTACANCHAARTSDGGVMALLPGIATCRQCHAGEAAGGQRVASTCVSCHWFHDPKHPLVKPALAEQAELPGAEIATVQLAHILQASPAKGGQP